MVPPNPSLRARPKPREPMYAPERRAARVLLSQRCTPLRCSNRGSCFTEIQQQEPSLGSSLLLASSLEKFKVTDAKSDPPDHWRGRVLAARTVPGTRTPKPSQGCCCQRTRPAPGSGVAPRITWAPSSRFRKTRLITTLCVGATCLRAHPTWTPESPAGPLTADQREKSVPTLPASRALLKASCSFLLNEPQGTAPAITAQPSCSIRSSLASLRLCAFFLPCAAVPLQPQTPAEGITSAG